MHIDNSKTATHNLFKQDVQQRETRHEIINRIGEPKNHASFHSSMQPDCGLWQERLKELTKKFVKTTIPSVISLDRRTLELLKRRSQTNKNVEQRNVAHAAQRSTRKTSLKRHKKNPSLFDSGFSQKTFVSFKASISGCKIRRFDLHGLHRRRSPPPRYSRRSPRSTTSVTTPSATTFTAWTEFSLHLLDVRDARPLDDRAVLCVPSRLLELFLEKVGR